MPHTHRLDLSLSVLPSQAEARARFLARFSPSWAAFAEGWGGVQRAGRDAWQPDFGALVGLRGEW